MPHLDEGTIHSWLDGALPPDEAASAAAHVASCAACSALVAEARGFIAAASRILTSLDDVPGQVIPGAAPVAPASAPVRGAVVPIAAHRAKWWRVTPNHLRVAAAIAFVAGTSVLVSRVDEGSFTSARAIPATAVVPESVASPTMSAESRSGPPPAAAPSPADARATPTAPTEAAIAKIAEPVRRQREGAFSALPRIARDGAGEGARADATQSPAAARPTVADASAPRANAVEELERERQAGEKDEQAARAAAPVPSPVVPQSRNAAVAGMARESARQSGTRLSAETASGASAADSRIGTGVVEGTVKDRASGSPLAGATISFADAPQSAQTDSSGRFRLEGVPAGTRAAVARRLGFATARDTVTVPAGGRADLDLALAPTRAALQSVIVSGAAAGATAFAAPACFQLSFGNWTRLSETSRAATRRLPSRVLLDSAVVGRPPSDVRHVRATAPSPAGNFTDGEWSANANELLLEWTLDDARVSAWLVLTGSLDVLRGNVEISGSDLPDGGTGTITARTIRCASRR